MNSIMFNTLCELLPEGVNWGDNLTPQLAYDILCAWDRVRDAALQSGSDLPNTVAEAKCKEDVVGGAAQGEQDIAHALGDLLKYLDDHDWGLVPEGKTADRARDALSRFEAALSRPNAPVLQGEREALTKLLVDLRERCAIAAEDIHWGGNKEVYHAKTSIANLIRNIELDVAVDGHLQARASSAAQIQEQPPTVPAEASPGGEVLK